MLREEHRLYSCWRLSQREQFLFQVLGVFMASKGTPVPKGKVKTSTQQTTKSVKVKASVRDLKQQRNKQVKDKATEKVKAKATKAATEKKKREDNTNETMKSSKTQKSGRKNAVPKKGENDQEMEKVINNLQELGVEEHWAIRFNEIKFRRFSGSGTDFEDWEKFDQGAGGSIFRVTWRGLECVAKTCPLSVGKQVLTDLANEIKILSTLRHPNVVMLLGACFEPEMAPIFLMEFCAGGNMEKKLCKLQAANTRLKSKVAMSYILDIALAMNFLHKCDPQISKNFSEAALLVSHSVQVFISFCYSSQRLEAK